MLEMQLKVLIVLFSASFGDALPVRLSLHHYADETS